MASKHRCVECGEELPPNLRFCPYCCYNDNYSDRCHCVVSPVPYLKMMRGYLEEILLLPPVRGVRDGESQTLRDLVLHIEVVESLLNCSFADNRDVMSAVDIVYEIMWEEVSKRKRRVRRNRILLFVIVMILVLMC
ncbi:MAG: zinc ribbon domain-containing protein [Rikenellaceae bacterium]